MVIRVTILFFLLIIYSGCSRIIILSDKSKVPLAKNYFNKSYRNINELPIYIDSTAVYILESSKRDGVESPNNGEYYSILKFYPGGQVNLFIRSKNIAVQQLQFNPNKAGYRGILFQESGKVMMAVFEQASGIGTMGLRRHEITLIGDTLKVKLTDDKTENFFTKKHILNNTLSNSAVW